MNYPKKCDTCRHTERCRWLLGESYRPNGPCDWVPSRWVLGCARVCPSCGLKYGHDLGCEYVKDCVRRQEEKAQRAYDNSIERMEDR